MVARPELPLHAPEHVHQLGDLPALIGLVAARDRVLDAMRDVILQHFFLNPAQRRAHGGDLRDDIDTVAIFIDHAREPAHLAFDPVETFLAGRLDVLSHVAYIPP